MNEIDLAKNIKKIDIHAHATPFKEFYPSISDDPKDVWVSTEEVIKLYDDLNIEKGVLLPLTAADGQASPITSEECKFLSDKYSDRFYWFCGVDPRARPNSVDGDLDRFIKHYKNLGAKGVGEITSLLYADDPKLYNLFAACERNDMPIIIHVATSLNWGYGIYDDIGLPRLEKILSDFPKLKVLGHSHGFWCELSSDLTPQNRNDGQTSKVKDNNRILELFRKYPNLYGDLSAGSGAGALMRDEEFAAKFIEEFSDRLLYGCDLCLAHQTFPYDFNAFLEGMLEKGTLSPENYKKLVRDNAIRILKLD